MADVNMASFPLPRNDLKSMLLKDNIFMFTHLSVFLQVLAPMIRFSLNVHSTVAVFNH